MGNTQQKQEVSLAKTEEDKSGEEESSTFTCEICIEPTLSVKKFKNNDECFHSFCVDCFAKYIEVKVEDNVASIKCPALDCNHLLDPLICQTIISVELFNKWCDLLCDSSLLVLDRCYCPYQNCSALVINECGGTVKKSTCPNCKKLFCYTCQVPWHAGYWCTESQQRRDANDVNFGVLLEKFQWNRCPMCGQAVELIDGCQNVKCRYASLTLFSNFLIFGLLKNSFHTQASAIISVNRNIKTNQIIVEILHHNSFQLYLKIILNCNLLLNIEVVCCTRIKGIWLLHAHS